MPFDTATKTNILSGFDALRAQVEALEPSDALEQELAQANITITELTADNAAKTSRIGIALTAVGQAETALATARAALDGTTPV